MKWPDDFINKVICADCLDILPLIPDGAVDLVVTDIPYGVVNRAAVRQGGLRQLNKGKADDVNFILSNMLFELCRACVGSWYIFCGTEQVSPIRRFLVDSKLQTRHGYWEKDNPSPMNGRTNYLSACENVIIAKALGATFNGFCKKPIWHSPVVTNHIHPTQKPLVVMSDMIRTSSNPSDIVFDPFAGSGSTLVAAKQLGRKYIGIEISPEYCKIAEDRLRQEELF